MKVTFINPNFRAGASKDAAEPYVFAILKSLTPKDVEVKLFDERLESVDFDEPTDCVAISIQSFTARRAYAIAAVYRKKSIPVILGGIHPTLLPEEAHLHGDAVAIGDAEPLWPQIIKDLKAGNLKKEYRAGNVFSLKGITPDRTIFKGKKYSFLKPVQFGRGCKFNCDFCSIKAVYGSSLRQRPVDDVVAEIRSLNSKSVFFIDDNLFANFERVTRLLKALIPLKIRWACQISIDAAFNPPLLDLMRAAGCMTVFVGLESFNDKNLKQMNKKGNIHYKDYAAGINNFKEYGMMVCGSFVFGYDYDTLESINEAYDFAFRTKLCLAHFNMVFPSPGTMLFKRLQLEKKLLLDTWWLNPEFRYGDPLFHPKSIGPWELAECCHNARIKFNTFPNILKRALDFKANFKNLYNLFTFLVVNMITHYEIKRKQGMKLG